MIRGLLLWASQNRWMAQTLPRKRFVQRAVRRFLPGEDRDAALTAAESLRGEGIGTVFTLLGENVTTPDEVEEVVQEYLTLLEEIERRGLQGEISVKPTQLGLDLGLQVAMEAIRRLARAAEEKTGSLVWVDMEATGYREATLDLFKELTRSVKGVGICLQAYLRSSPDDLRSLLSLDPAIRIVKGAYAEAETLAFPKRASVDEAFFRLVTQGLEGGARMAIATHDSELIQKLRVWVEDRKVSDEQYEFQMLYGIQSGAQRALAQAGEPVRVLISYGPSWFPWYMRRLAERPANIWFVLKNLFVGG